MFKLDRREGVIQTPKVVLTTPVFSTGYFIFHENFHRKFLQDFYPPVIKHGVLENPSFSDRFFSHFITSIDGWWSSLTDFQGLWYSQPTTGWWLKNHLEKYEFVNGKDYISHIWNRKIKNVPNHQPLYIYALRWFKKMAMEIFSFSILCDVRNV